MKTKKPIPKKKYFSVAEANSILPLARAIVNDIATFAHDLRERQKRLLYLQANDCGKPGPQHQEELDQFVADFERDKDQMCEYVKELTQLGIELKDYDTGLIDFPCRLDDREVYLCWRLGEPEVSHWHELNAGFAGRREITSDFPCRSHADSQTLNI